MNGPSQNDILECVSKEEPRWSDVERHRYDRLLGVFTVMNFLAFETFMMCVLLAGRASCQAL
ncbi:hypothetical protein GS535_03530 [Saccharibacter sp. EH611]|uniref:hypothetical protein n=1 Tax=unclassified Saccharibacter TaxID=2648722 RepID=UPI001322FC36|nr:MULTISPECIES: hypothetical protein [unclassified Saccharibacter]MXV35628.1 hypothetical protein [Saccharibacter sp. EH611]MXV65760.1 hypothetical protein [Saccharibacter sp. EH60]